MMPYVASSRCAASSVILHLQPRNLEAMGDNWQSCDHGTFLLLSTVGTLYGGSHLARARGVGHAQALCVAAFKMLGYDLNQRTVQLTEDAGSTGVMALVLFLAGSSNGQKVQNG